jgi:hypothetical protein
MPDVILFQKQPVLQGKYRAIARIARGLRAIAAGCHVSETLAA